MDIGSDVWVGGAALILPSVHRVAIVIGAGSVVTRDVPEGVLAGGNPWRVLAAMTCRPVRLQPVRVLPSPREDRKRMRVLVRLISSNACGCPARCVPNHVGRPRVPRP